MQTEAIPYSLCFGIAGVVAIGMGLWLILGINRVWWQWRILPFQEGYFWAAIPLGTGAILLAIAALFPLASTGQRFFFWGSMTLILVAIVFAFGPPNFLKPKWLRDLEKRHPNRAKYLRDQARQMETDKWLKIVHDPILLEQWADEEVRKMHS
jgi:MFS family permease